MTKPGKIYGIAFVAVLGGFLFGYDTAVISGAVESLNRYFIVPMGLPEKAANTLLGFVVACALIGCVIGSSLGGHFSRKFGRKRSLLLAALLFLVSSLGSAIPEMGVIPAGSKAAMVSFIIFRIMGGTGIGLASVLSPMYIAEVSPAGIRGRLVSWNQLAITLGTPGLVRQKTTELLDVFGKTNRFILNAGCAIPPTTPEENIFSLVETVKNYYEEKN